MADTFPQYPATSFDQAVDLTIYASNQLGDVINGDATSVVSTESGDIPTLRKALIDNFYFKNPIQWNPGNTNTVFNQLYVYDTDNINKGWYYAPTATATNPILMGDTPVGDANWKLYSLVTTGIPAQVFPWSTEITQTTTSIVPPYEFDTVIVTYNGVILIPGKDYTLTNNTLTFTPPLTPEPDAEVPDILFCYIGKLEEGNPNTNYVTYNSLAAPTAADLIGISTVGTVEDAIKGRINAAAFGVVANYNPTTNTGTDNTAALQAAAQYCINNNIAELILPEGDILFSGTIPLDDGSIGEAVPDRFKGTSKGFTIRGAGMYSTKLVFDPPAIDTPAIRVTGGWGTHSPRGIFDLAVVPRTTADYNVTANGQAIQFIGGCFVPIKNVIIGRFNKGICLWNKNKGINDTGNTFTQGDFTEFIRTSNCRIFNCDIAVDFLVSLGNNSFHGCSFDKTQIQIKPYGGIGIRMMDDGSRAAIVPPTSNYQYIANVYNAKFDINFFGRDGSNCYALWLKSAQGRGCSGDMTAEAAIILKTDSFEWFQSFGSLHSISSITTEVGDTDTATRPVAFMFNNAAYPQNNFDGVDSVLLSTSYPRQFDLNNSGNTGMDLLNIRGAQSGNIWSQLASSVSAGWIFSTRTTSNSRSGQRTIWQFSYDGTKIKAPLATSVGIYNSSVGMDLTNVALIPSVNNTINLGSSSFRFNTAYLNGWNIGSAGLVPTSNNSVNIGSSSLFVNASYVTRRVFSTTVSDMIGTGSPEGIVAGGVGSTYRRTDGAAGSVFYVKEAGSGNTGWVAK